MFDSNFRRRQSNQKGFHTELKPIQKVTQVASTEVSWKRLWPVLLALLGLGGLLFYVIQTPQTNSQTPSDPVNNKILVEQVYTDLGHSPDLDLMAQLFTADFQYHFSDGEANVHGPEGEKDWDEIYWDVQTHRRHQVESVTLLEEMVVIRWIRPNLNQISADNTFTLPSDEIKSRVVNPLSGTTIWQISDGKISEVWVILD